MPFLIVLMPFDIFSLILLVFFDLSFSLDAYRQRLQCILTFALQIMPPRGRAVIVASPTTASVVSPATAIAFANDNPTFVT